jgi:hypothetical protein
MNYPIVEAVISLALLMLVGAVMSLLLALPVMLLWNWLMPAIFGLKAITLLQAWGLSLLCRLLWDSGSIKYKKAA